MCLAGQPCASVYCSCVSRSLRWLTPNYTAATLVGHSHEGGRLSEATTFLAISHAYLGT